jgi:endonuclease/exonuclease/phosphatase family metal-dependent hydrolase
VVCVYNPAWPIDRARFHGIDVSGVKLKLDPDVWVGDILWAALHHSQYPSRDLWLVGGDFNLSESFDWRPKGPRGNKEYLDRMAALGLVECLRQSTGCVTPTFRNTDGQAVKHQLDHIFVSRQLALALAACRTGSQEQVFGRLSDHLPVLADFDFNGQHVLASAQHAV